MLDLILRYRKRSNMSTHKAKRNRSDQARKIMMSRSQMKQKVG